MLHIAPRAGYLDRDPRDREAQGGRFEEESEAARCGRLGVSCEASSACRVVGNRCDLANCAALYYDHIIVQNLFESLLLIPARTLS